MLRLDDVTFRYEPFPVGVAKNVFEPSLYDELSSTFPPRELFEHGPDLGHRYSFAARQQREFLRRNAAWREIERWVTSRQFLVETFSLLARHHIDLGVDDELRFDARRVLRALRHGRFPQRLRAKLVFVMLPADGGFLLPHTDAPPKVLNIATSMIRPGEWDESFGGSTDIDWPHDSTKSFNYVNRRTTFDDVRLVDRVPFAPNQAVMVVKTFNSWHSIRPMTGRGSPVMRKTVNINIVRE